MKRLLAIVVAMFPALAWGQSAILQGGAWTPGHVPQYVMTGNSQAIVIDGGGASGGPIGTNVGEIGVVARGTGTAPYASQGTGPFGTIGCFYDAPTNNATGYHYLCLSPNAQGGGLLAYGAGGAASQLPLAFNINGTIYSFPFTTSGIVGPGTTVVNDAACWNNTVGTLLKDCGAFVTVGGTNTWTGTNNFTGTFQIGGVTQTFPASGNILGTSDVQTITNKSINAAQINSGTLSSVVFPALTGDVTNSAGSLATSITPAAVTNTKLAVGAANTVKGTVNGTSNTDIAFPSCSGGTNAIQWVIGTGPQCAALGVQSAGYGLALNAGVLSIATAQPPYGFDQPVNLGLSAAAAGSNLTITLTGANGSTASATNPVSIPFRSSTLTTGTPVWSVVTGALSLVIPSGATLGTSSSNIPFRLWIYASYNGGTPQLGAAVCSTATQVYPCASWEYTKVTSTTISGLATSSGVLYATAGASSDPVRIIGYCDYASGLATAGSWASACTTLQLFGPGIKKPGDIVQTIYTQNGSLLSTTNTYTPSATPPTTAGAGQIIQQAITPTASMNSFLVQGQSMMGGNNSNMAYTNFIFNGTSVLAVGSANANNGAVTIMNTPASVRWRGLAGSSAVTFSLYATGNQATVYINGEASTNFYGGLSNTFLQIDEIMGALEPDNDNHPLSMVG